MAGYLQKRGLRQVKRQLRTAEETPSIRVGDLYTRGAPRSGGPFVRRTGAYMSEVAPELTAHEDWVDCVYCRSLSSGKVETVEYVLYVSWIDTNLGDGRRPYLHCADPSCRRRVGRLFLEDPYLFCRECAGVRYSSQRGHPSTHERVLARIREIRSRLGVAVPGMPVLDRPKRMHLTTYDKLCVELAELEEVEQEYMRLALLAGRYAIEEYLTKGLSEIVKWQAKK